MSYTYSESSAFTITAVLVVLVVAIRTAEGQSPPPPPTCVEKLIPCAEFINSTKPPDTCCGPLKEAVTQQRDCLCNLYSTPGLLPSLGINLTEAILLPGRCGIPGDLSACTKGVSGNDGYRLRAIAWTGLTTLIFLLWSSMLLYS